MAGHSSSVLFKTRWEDILKRKFGKQTKPYYMIVPFSEILLNTLCYGTDIGYIPRRIDSEGVTVPISEDRNWGKDITGCYWCGNKSTDVQGICCGNDCIFYFHEWCVERAGMFQQWRFCKLPGCESIYSDQSKYECCSVAHKEKYIRDFLSFHNGDKLKRQLSLGPSWYDNITHKSDSSHNQVQTSSSSTIQPDFSKAKMCLAEELSTALLFYTDVGPIPRSYRLSGDSSSQYSTHANWNRKIEGCYLCKQRTSDNEYLCSERCYLIFHEWCRLKVYKHIKMNYCRLPGCKHKSRPDVSTCSDTHSELLRYICEKYKLPLSEFNRLVAQGPYWYDNFEISITNVTSDPSKTGATFKVTGVPTSVHSRTEATFKVTAVPISVHSKTESPRDFYIFSHALTEWMYEQSDIGPIPRSILGKFPHLHSFNKHNSPNNWDTDIPMCYWCCTRDHNVHSITCSDKCFFLFNEWCHKKYKCHKSHKKLCKHPSCNSTTIFSDYCWKDSHGTLYEQKYSTKYFYLLKSTEYFLGPRWYWDKSVRSIDFYNREDPFHEFTNFYPCNQLKINGCDWSTTEHYFQAQKFIGTPHVEHVRKLKTPREAFDYTRRPEILKWIRPDWQKVKEDVMLKALEEKFHQNEDLAHILIQTGEADLYEHTQNDNFWGDGGDRRGKNVLGKLLKQVRFDLYNKCLFLPSRLEHLKASVPDTPPPKSPAPQTMANNISPRPFSTPESSDTHGTSRTNSSSTASDSYETSKVVTAQPTAIPKDCATRHSREFLMKLKFGDHSILPNTEMSGCYTRNTSSQHSDTPDNSTT